MNSCIIAHLFSTVVTHSWLQYKFFAGMKKNDFFLGNISNIK